MRRFCLQVFLLILIACAFSAPEWAYCQATAPASTLNLNISDQNINTLEKQLSLLTRQKQNLTKERRKLMEQLKDLNREIKKLKAEKDLGFFSERKLQTLLPEHQQVSRKIEKLDAAMDTNREKRRGIKKKLEQIYEIRISKAVKALSKEKNRDKQIAIVHEYFTLKDKARKYRLATSSTSGIGDFSVELDPMDGLREINDKIALLQDRIVRLQGVIKEIDKKIRTLQREKKLAEEMHQMIEERNLFEEGVKFMPSPRTLPVRRPEDGGTGTDGGDDQYDEAGVHLSPLASDAPGGRNMMLSAIDKEIKRLKQEKKFLKQVIDELLAKISEFTKKARELSGQ